MKRSAPAFSGNGAAWQADGEAPHDARRGPQTHAAAGPAAQAAAATQQWAVRRGLTGLLQAGRVSFLANGHPQSRRLQRCCGLWRRRGLQRSRCGRRKAERGQLRRLVRVVTPGWWNRGGHRVNVHSCTALAASDVPAFLHALCAVADEAAARWDRGSGGRAAAPRGCRRGGLGRMVGLPQHWHAQEAFCATCLECQALQVLRLAGSAYEHVWSWSKGSKTRILHARTGVFRMPITTRGFRSCLQGGPDH